MQALGCALDGSLVSEGREDGPRHADLVGLGLPELRLPASIRVVGSRILASEVFESATTPELDARGLRRWGGGLTSAAVGKDRADDPSRTLVDVVLSVGRQDPIELDGDGTQIGAARVLSDLPVDVGVEGSIPKLDETFNVMLTMGFIH